MQAIEDKVFEFLTEAIEAAGEDDPLYQAELQDTVWKKIEKPHGIRIGDGYGYVELDGQDITQEYDTSLTLAIYAAIEKASRTERAAARTRVFNMTAAISQLFLRDEKMGGRVCNSRPIDVVRGWDNFESKPYAVANLQMVFNETGGGRS